MILWQVDIAFDATGASRFPKQFIKVWTVEKDDRIVESIDRVSMIQKTYTRERVRRCRKKPGRSNRKLIPLCFSDLSAEDYESIQADEKLDVTVLDANALDMTSMASILFGEIASEANYVLDKFYPLTELLIQAIRENDLTSEFPFDVSRDELDVISHSETASPILGRSGTSKTTCLILKMVSRYLAQRNNVNEKPVRQVSFCTYLRWLELRFNTDSFDTVPAFGR